MPIYEYRCSACGHELEALQKLSDPLLLACPECGKPALNKLVTAAGFHLKGSGWYATDFKGSGSKPAAKAAGAKDGGSKPAESKTESKESKTDSKSSATETTSSSSSAGGCGGKCACH
jgi:putative FmdB family regulatory protein